MKYIVLTIALFIQAAATAQAPASYVNPFIGTGGHGHTFPGATVPFGMVQLSPDTRIDGSWDGCSGYHDSDSLIYGFSHTHLSGTGCSDYGDIAILPFTDYMPADKGHAGKFDYRHYAQAFSHATEKATVGYYNVQLRSGIAAELTATTRVGVHRYTFPAAGDARLVVQLDHRDKTLESGFKIANNRRVEGYRRSQAWAKDQHIYFVMEFSEPFAAELSSKSTGGKGLEKFLYQVLSFGKLNGKPLVVKVGISNVGIDGARQNLESEATGGDFDSYKKAAEDLWNKELSKITVYGKNQDELRIFYTALYHTMIQPNVAMDVNGMYRGRDNALHIANGFTYYSVFSLWDTFRATHPLYTLIDQKRTSDFINTFLAQYQQSGRLPMWELASNETDCMIGYHSVSVIADAYIKGIEGYDANKAYEAMLAAASYTRMGIPQFNRQNYLQVDDEPESVSKTLEYAYDDWCIAQVAQKLGKKDDYQRLMRKAQAYKNMFDAQTGFMRPRKNGNWLSPFDPREVNNHYTEANAWQYTFFVPQDVDGLIKLMGGDKAFERKLDDLFSAPTETTGRDQADITGLIGQYAHGNEPSHHMAYLYNYVGKPYKTQEKVQKIIGEFYKNTRDGLIGNEDCGQMSAWYVMSAMGFYPVCPGSQEYILGKPLFDSVFIRLENGKTATIRKTAADGKPDMKYMSSLTLNGQPYMRSALSHSVIMNGATLMFNMAATPDSASTYGKNHASRPSHKPAVQSIVAAPVIVTPAKIFDDRTSVSMESIDRGVQLFYTLDGSAPNKTSFLYVGPFMLDTTTVISVKAYKQDDSSATTTTHVYKRPNHWTIDLKSAYNKQYAAGGREALIDGLHGDLNWRKGEWQGYQSQDFECIIDLGKVQTVSKCSAGFLQDAGSWIMFPVKVEFYVSPDGKTYEPVETIINTVKPESEMVQMHEFATSGRRTHKGRYVKVKAYNLGKLPAWHQGAGGDAFIFIDEINIR